VSDDPLARLDGLLDDSAAFKSRAEQAARAATEGCGTDGTGCVTVTVNAEGQLATIEIRPAWRTHYGPDGLGAAIVEAARGAAADRLEAWGEAYADPKPSETVAARLALVDTLAAELARLTSASRVTGENTEAALRELLAIAEDVERGIDEVTEKVAAATTATHTGRTRYATVTVTGSVEVTGVRLDRAWSQRAHETNLAREVLAALRDAYRTAAQHGAQQIVADTRLGRAQRVLEDPADLARRLRLSD
jgi:DNA-binding protein YbaB